MNKNNTTNILTDIPEDIREYMTCNNLSAITLLEDNDNGEFVIENNNYSLNVYTL